MYNIKEKMKTEKKNLILNLEQLILSYENSCFLTIKNSDAIPANLLITR